MRPAGEDTYGTGNFMLLNTGRDRAVKGRSADDRVLSDGGQRTDLRAEGSIAVTGSAVQWLRDQLGIITSQRSGNAGSIRTHNGGVYFVPAFSGLFAPYWRSDARGAILGLSRSTPRTHSRARRSKRSASRPVPCSTRW